MNRGLPYSFLLCMAGYNWTFYISGTTGLVRLTCSGILPGGVYANQPYGLILAGYKLREYVSCRLRAQGVGGIAGRVIVGDGAENEERRNGQAKSRINQKAPPSSG